MVSYRVELKRSVLKDLRRIPMAMLERIRQAIEALRDDPFPPGFEKVRGYESYCRVRVGQYRIIYHVAATIRIITVIRIGHRKDIYRGM